MRRHIAPVLLALLALLTVAGCGDDGGGADEEATATTGLSEDPLDGRTFQAVSTEGEEERDLVPGVPLRIGFADGEITVETGCNELTAAYEIEEVILVVEPIGGTEVMCPTEELTEQQAWFVGLLADRPIISPQLPDGLVLAYGEKGTRLQMEVVDSDEAPTAELVGPTWEADTIIDGESAGSLPAGVTASITFADDGTYQVATGCNTGDGTYAEAGPDLYAVDPPTLTRRSCDGSAAEVEAVFVAVLDGEVSATIEADRLTLTRAPAEAGPGATTEPGATTTTTTTEPDPDAGKGIAFTAG